MQDLKFIESIAERDIDFLILEELQVSHAFREWFTARVFEQPVFKSHVGAWHSVVDPVLGESDLIFMFDAEDGSTKAILIENKISAAPQPDQAKRYLARGDKGQLEETWQEYRTCVIAPRKYLESPVHTNVYQSQIPYEEIMAYFAAARSVDERQRYRATMMLEAVDQHRRGYTAKIDDTVTEFVRTYWQFVQASHPSLGMREPKQRPAGNTWIFFYPAGIPKTMDVVHQLTAGYVKVFFKQRAADYEAIANRYQELTGVFPGLAVELAGKSVSITIPVTPVNPLDTQFDSAKASVAAALDILSRLIPELHRLGLPQWVAVGTELTPPLLLA
jgi:hypothetical protein